MIGWTEHEYGSGSTLKLAEGQLTASYRWSHDPEETGYTAMIGRNLHKKFRTIQEARNWCEQKLREIINQADKEMKEITDNIKGPPPAAGPWRDSAKEPPPETGKIILVFYWPGPDLSLIKYSRSRQRWITNNGYSTPFPNYWAEINPPEVKQ